MVVKVTPGGAHGVAIAYVLPTKLVKAACEASGLGGGGQGGSRTGRAIRRCDLYVPLCAGLDVFVRRTIRWIVRWTKFLVAQTFSGDMAGGWLSAMEEQAQDGSPSDQAIVYPA